MEFNIIIEKDEEGYFVSEVIELPGCHTQAKSIEELMKRTREAVSLYLKATGMQMANIGEKFIGIRKIEI
jgi:predicted RNase H-like HicB family nuclease